MNTKSTLAVYVATLLAAFNFHLASAFAQGTAFTYQGRLDDGVNPAAGIYDLRFTIYDSASAGSVVGGPVTNSLTSVSNGLFTVTLDFGAGVFTGANRWLEIGVRTNGGAAFTSLTPRQLFTASPYAVWAASATTAGSVAAANITGTVADNILSGNVALRAGGNTFSGVQTMSDVLYVGEGIGSATGNSRFNFNAGYNDVTMTLRQRAADNVILAAQDPAGFNRLLVTGAGIFSEGDIAVSGGFSGSGSNLTSLNASQLTSGIVPDARLTTNVARLDGTNRFTSSNFFAGVLVATNGSNQIVGTFSGNAGSLSNLQANKLVGTIATANIGAGSITATQIAPEAVTADAIAAGAVTFPKLGVVTRGQVTRTITDPVSPELFGFPHAFGQAMTRWDADRVIITNPYYDDKICYPLIGCMATIGDIGSIWIYNTNDASITGLPYPSLSSPPSNAQWGYSVAQAGQNILVGAPGVREVWVMFPGGSVSATPFTPRPGGHSNDRFGESLATLGGGTLTLIGSPQRGSGVVDVFLTGANPRTVLATLSLPYSRFGSKLATVSSNLVAIAAPLSFSGGHVFVYNISYQPFVIVTNLVTTISNPGSSPTFGIALQALDTRRVLIGSDGAAYLFSTNGTLLTTFTNPEPESVGGFGTTLTSWGTDRVVVGAQTKDVNGVAGAGVLYVFNTNGTWLGIMPNPAPTMNANFSRTLLALDDSHLMVAANDLPNGGALGSARIVTLDSFQYVPQLSIGPGQNVALLDQDQVFVGDTKFTRPVTASGFLGNGSGLTNLNANQLSSGTVPDARLSTNVSLLGPGIDGSEITDGTIADADVNPAAAISDTKLATISAAGKVADSALSANVALRNGGNNFTGNQTVTSGNVGIGTTNPTATLDVVGGTRVRGESQNWAALTEYNNYTNSTFRGFVGMDGIGLTGTANQLYVGTYTAHPVRIFTSNTERLVVDSSGNVGIGSVNPTNKLMVVNARCDGSSWINASDRNLKQDFAAVDPQAVLDKVASLPIQSWSYKAQPDQKHVGPVAQDFRAAFGLGQDDTSIATVDADGVALAAIQGLNQKLELTRVELRRRDAENAALQARLEKLEQLLSNRLNGGNR